MPYTNHSNKYSATVTTIIIKIFFTQNWKAYKQFSVQTKAKTAASGWNMCVELQRELFVVLLLFN